MSSGLYDCRVVFPNFHFSGVLSDPGECVSEAVLWSSVLGVDGDAAGGVSTPGLDLIARNLMQTTRWSVTIAQARLSESAPRSTCRVASEN